MIKNKLTRYIAVLATSALATSSMLSFTASAETLPTSYNSVEQGYVTEVKNQGKWGVCWAFATTAASEVSLNKEYGKDIDISENLLIYTTNYATTYGNIGNDKLANTFTGNTDYLSGNNPSFAAHIMMNWFGPFEENADYPYNSSGTPSIADKTFTEDEWNKLMDSRIAQLTDYYVVEATDDDYISKTKRLVSTYGAASISYYDQIESGSAAGHLNCIDGEYYYFCPFSTLPNHGVTIVGYDDSIPAENFANNGYKPAGNGGWLIKNSWGTDVLDEGYLWLSYYDTTIEKIVAFDFAMKGDDDYYDNLYAYDGGCPNSMLYYTGSPTVYSANVFTAEGSETIKAVSFYSGNSGTVSYEVSLYLNPTDATNPASGTKATSTTFTSDIMGYNTVELPDEIEVEAGDTFSVVVKTSTDADTAYAYFENSTSSSDSRLYVEITANEGESFLSHNGSSWIDTEKYGQNASIKAYTYSKIEKPTLTVTESDGKAYLQWNEIEGIDHYEIYFLNDNEYQYIGDVNKCSATLSNLAFDEEYTFVVKAVTKNGRTSESDPVSITIKAPLAAPVVTATPKDSKVSLSWEAIEGASCYEIYYLNDGAYASAGQTQKTAVSITNLTNGTEYTFKVKAIAEDGRTSESSPVTATPVVSLTKPVLNAIEGEEAIQLSWDENTAASGYIIEQYIDDKWTQIADITDNKVVTYEVTNLTAGFTYEFRMMSYTSYSEELSVYSEYSDSITCTIPFPAITGFKSPSKSTTAIRLNWTANDAVEGYVIEQYIDGNWVQIADITDNTTVTYKVTSLVPGTAYSFRMFAYSDESSSDYTEELTISTQMTAVKGFKSPSKSTSAIRLNWTKNAYADGYVIDQYTNRGWVQIADITDPETVTYKVTGLKSGTAYKFRMKAYSVAETGEVIYGSKTSTLTVNTQASAVTGLALKSRSSTALRLKWTKNTAVDGYIIEQYIDNEWVQIADIDNYKTTEYKVTGLKASTKYKFRMKAYAITKYGEKTYSPYTGSLSKTTSPSTVSGLKVKSKAQTAIRLAWSKNTSATGYCIEQYKDGNWVQVAKIEDNATLNYRIDGLKKTTTYKFRVRTYYMAGTTTLYSDYKTISGTTNS